MASCVIPNEKRRFPIIKCEQCKTLYVSEHNHLPFVEDCPICGYTMNNTHSNRIPLWRYNLIKWFRGGFKE